MQQGSIQSFALEIKEMHRYENSYLDLSMVKMKRILLGITVNHKLNLNQRGDIGRKKM